MNVDDNIGCTLETYYCRFISNEARNRDGGAIYIYNGTYNGDNNEFIGNMSYAPGNDANGGAICNDNSIYNGNNNIFIGNKAQSGDDSGIGGAVAAAVGESMS